MQGEGRRFEPVILHEILEKVVQTFSARIFGNRQHNLEVEMRKMLRVLAVLFLAGCGGTEEIEEADAGCVLDRVQKFPSCQTLGESCEIPSLDKIQMLLSPLEYPPAAISYHSYDNFGDLVCLNPGCISGYACDSFPYEFLVVNEDFGLWSYGLTVEKDGRSHHTRYVCKDSKWYFVTDDGYTLDPNECENSTWEF